MRNGEIKLARWLGFITALEARERQDEVKPVKLVVSRIDGEDLESGEYVQGCLDSNGAWAVPDTSVRVIRTRSVSAK